MCCFAFRTRILYMKTGKKIKLFFRPCPCFHFFHLLLFCSKKILFQSWINKTLFIYFFPMFLSILIVLLSVRLVLYLFLSDLLWTCFCLKYQSYILHCILLIWFTCTFADFWRQYCLPPLLGPCVEERWIA